MAEKVWPNPGVVAESRKFVCVSIDADNNPELAARYHAEGLPTVVFADSFGNELARLVGLHKADVMVQAMQPIPADFSPIRSFNERLERDRGNVQALVGVAGFYQKQGALAVSTRYYLRALRGMDEAGDGRTKQDVLEELGMNFLRMKSYDHAAQTFEEYLAEFPDGRRTDTVLLALLTAQLYQGQLDQAERTLAELERKYPSSTAVERGRRNLETARASRP
jgi:tetratricopeptide (TPR) repeat protein